MTAIPPAGRDAPTRDPNRSCDGDTHWFAVDVGLGGIRDGTRCWCGEKTHHSMLGRAAAVSPDAPEPRPNCEQCGEPMGLTFDRDMWICGNPMCGVFPAAAPRPAGPTPEGEPREITRKEWWKRLAAEIDEHRRESPSYIGVVDNAVPEALPENLVAAIREVHEADPVGQDVVALCGSHESLRTALASARVALVDMQAVATSEMQRNVGLVAENESLRGLLAAERRDHAIVEQSSQAALSEATRRPRWWEAAVLHGPFWPDGNGGNDGIVRDDTGSFVCDTRGYEARADVIAELLNRTARAALPEETRHGE